MFEREKRGASVHRRKCEGCHGSCTGQGEKTLGGGRSGAEDHREGGGRRVPPPRVREGEALSVRPSKKVREVSRGSCTCGGEGAVSRALWGRGPQSRRERGVRWCEGRSGREDRTPLDLLVTVEEACAPSNNYQVQTGHRHRTREKRLLIGIC